MWIRNVWNPLLGFDKDHWPDMADPTWQNTIKFILRHDHIYRHDGQPRPCQPVITRPMITRDLLARTKTGSFP